MNNSIAPLGGPSADERTLGFKIDLEKSEDELYRETEAFCRDREGFKPMEEWRPGMTRPKIEEEMMGKFAEFRGVSFSFSQLIRDNIDEEYPAKRVR